MFKLNQLAKQRVSRIHLNPTQFYQQRGYLSRIELKREYFQKKEQVFINDYSTKISLFKYDSGVEALKYQDDSIETIILPFQGHQIWDCKYKRTYKPSIGSNKDKVTATNDYHSITMQTPIFDEPIPVTNADPWDYLKTYGAYFIHCGILAMGVPTEKDNHGLHGEVANGQFKNSYIDIYETKDNQTGYKFVGEYFGKKQFDYNYKFTSSHYIQRDTSQYNLIETTAQIENYYHTDLPAMYLAHMNFRIELDSKLYYTATCNKHLEDVEIRTEIPAHVKPSQEYVDLLNNLSKNPSKHEVLDQKMIDLLDTEVVLTLNNYQTIQTPIGDQWGISFQKLKDDGSYICMHQPKQLPKVVRWMVCNKNLQALGLSLPATGGPEGRSKAMEKNEMIYVPAGDINNPGMVQFDFKHGYIGKQDSMDLIDTIEQHKKAM